ncbi:MAG: segregation ATPase FtsK/SpoIIIE, family, partial [Bacteroidota bacterium]|nr:segregation ATPase FtsK/SpoIIIE, family [Bacteroidota bacterium]
SGDEANTKISFNTFYGMVSGDQAVKAKAETTGNLLGLLGASISHFMFNNLIGYSLLLLPFILLIWSKNLLQKGIISERTIKITSVYLLLSLLFSINCGIMQNIPAFKEIPKEYSGAVGQFSAGIFIRFIGVFGSSMLFTAIFVGFLIFGTGIKPASIAAAFVKIFKSLSSGFEKIRTLILKKNENVDEKKADSIINNEIKADSKAAVEISAAQEKPDIEGTKSEDKSNYDIESSSVHPEIQSPNPIMRTLNKPTLIMNSDSDPARIISRNISFHNGFHDNETQITEQPNISTDRIITRENYLQHIKEKKNPTVPVHETELPIPIQEVKSPEQETKFVSKTLNGILEHKKSILKENNNIPIKEPVDEPYREPVDEPALEPKFPNQPEQIKVHIDKILNTISKIKEPVVQRVKNENLPVIHERTFPDEHDNKPLKVIISKSNSNNDIKGHTPLSVALLDEEINYHYPTSALLSPPDYSYEINEKELETNAQVLQEKLETFKIFIENMNITPGPVVTQYEFVPAPGIKLSKIEALADDLAMALKARGIRIIAPIPGKGTVGIEIPNLNPATVRFSELADSVKFQTTQHKLPLALGKTISGEVYIADLSKMPHLLMAGSTGSGKSVGINTIIASLIYKLHPKNLKFVIIDPKKVELRQYAKLANHFLAVSPDLEDEIITNPKDAIVVLKSVVLEMEMRYDIFARALQRNILEYNKNAKEGKFTHDKEFLHKPMPYIVVIIDELADLMLTAGKEIEEPITRLAQMARAVGIHLVLATQRPSVDVITGIIKANFPARIAYLVASKIDSRTILDVMGAEQLLGNGDMLFLPNGSPKPIRVQNSYISTEEVDSLCDFIGDQEGYSQPYTLPSLIEKKDDAEIIGAEDRDELFDEAARLVIRHQQASVSLVQRRLKVGYARAGRIIDELENAGIIGPFEGSKTRQVLCESEADLEAIL